MIVLLTAGMLAVATPSTPFPGHRDSRPLQLVANSSSSIFSGSVVSSKLDDNAYTSDVVVDEVIAGDKVGGAGQHVTVRTPAAALPGARYVFFLDPGKQWGAGSAPLKLRLMPGPEGREAGVILDADDYRFIPENIQVHEVKAIREPNWLGSEAPPPTKPQPPIVLRSYIDFGDFVRLIELSRSGQK